MSGSMFAPRTSQKGMWRTSAYQPASISAVSGGEMTARGERRDPGRRAALHADAEQHQDEEEAVIITGSETSAFAWIMKCRSPRTPIP